MIGTCERCEHRTETEPFFLRHPDPPTSAVEDHAQLCSWCREWLAEEVRVMQARGEQDGNRWHEHRAYHLLCADPHTAPALRSRMAQEHVIPRMRVARTVA